MHYDKKVYKDHYGHLYLNMMYWGLGFALLFMQLAWYPQFFHWDVPIFLIEFFATICMLCLIIGVGIGGYLYFDGKRIAKNQQQWIDKKKIYYRIERRKFLSFKNNEVHTYTYFVRQLEDMILTKRFITCKGSIHVTDEYGEKRDEFSVSELKIPRTFSNENALIEPAKRRKK